MNLIRSLQSPLHPQGRLQFSLLQHPIFLPNVFPLENPRKQSKNPSMYRNMSKTQEAEMSLLKKNSLKGFLSEKPAQ